MIASCCDAEYHKVGLYSVDAAEQLLIIVILSLDKAIEASLASHISQGDTQLKPRYRKLRSFASRLLRLEPSRWRNRTSSLTGQIPTSFVSPKAFND